MIQGLDFPGSNGVAVGETMRFRFVNPHSNGLPIYGSSGQGLTYIWRCYPRQQASYYTAFFWGNDGVFEWFSTGPYANTYYGFHPYPDPPPSGTDHLWEVSVHTNDYTNGAVVYDRWFTQVARVWGASGQDKHHELYWDWPNQDAGHMVTATITGVNGEPGTPYGDTNPPSPALTFGDAPWNQSNEVWDGILRGFQIYSDLLSLSDIASEITSPLSTTAGQNSIWYLNLNPTPDDISDHSGQGHHFSWVGSNRPTLFTEGGITDDWKALLH